MIGYNRLHQQKILCESYAFGILLHESRKYYVNLFRVWYIKRISLQRNFMVHAIILSRLCSLLPTFTSRVMAQRHKSTKLLHQLIEQCKYVELSVLTSKIASVKRYNIRKAWWIESYVRAVVFREFNARSTRVKTVGKGIRPWAVSRELRVARRAKTCAFRREFKERIDNRFLLDSIARRPYVKVRCKLTLSSESKRKATVSDDSRRRLYTFRRQRTLVERILKGFS